MLNITITEHTPHNMLRAIRAACNELLGDMPAERQILNEAVLNLKNDEQAARHVTAANEASALKQAFDQAVEKTGDAVVAKMLIGQQAEDGNTANIDYPTDADAPETDSTGAEWNPELHASTKTKNADGTWKKRRGASKVEEAPEPPALPPLPPAPPAAPLVTMNDIYALITNGKVVLNDVIAATQAMGFADVGAFSRDATPEQRAQLLAQLTAGAGA